MKNILITGGAGFIGSHVLRLFVNKYPDYQIFNLDSLTYAGNLEITSINQEYLIQNRLKIEIMGRGVTWLDTGSFSSLLEASNFIQIIEKRQSLKVACLEEIAFKKGFISREELNNLANKSPNNKK